MRYNWLWNLTLLQRGSTGRGGGIFTVGNIKSCGAQLGDLFWCFDARIGICAKTEDKHEFQRCCLLTTRVYITLLMVNATRQCVINTLTERAQNKYILQQNMPSLYSILALCKRYETIHWVICTFNNGIDTLSKLTQVFMAPWRKQECPSRPVTITNLTEQLKETIAISDIHILKQKTRV